MKSVTLILCLAACLSSGQAASVLQERYDVIGLANEVCYEHCGCFTTESPWTSLLRPVSALPNPPWVVGTRFLLYTRSNQQENFELMPDNEFILKFSPYDASRKTIFIIHGLNDGVQVEWIIKLKNALLEKENVNLLVVDWSPGAKGNYHKATANARLVGAQIERMAKFLAAKADLNFSEVRIIGHSIGAHVAGYVGERLNGEIGHIIAFDAAEPYFGGTDSLVRLDVTDAKHVHAIHTNGDIFGLGISSSFAHVDVYPNGGNTQPGCRDLLSGLVSSIIQFIFLDFEGALSVWACSHVRVVDFYIESVLSACPFVAYKCGSYNDFKNGKCTTACAAEGSCTVLGYGSESEKFSAARGNFYLNTDAKQRYCIQSVRFDAPVSQSQAKTNGKVTAQFRKSTGELSQKFTIVDGTVTNGQLLNKWLEVPSGILSSVAERPSLILRYTRGGLLPTTQPKYLSIDAITLYVLDKTLTIQKIEYQGLSMEAGTDIIVN